MVEKAKKINCAYFTHFFILLMIDIFVILFTYITEHISSEKKNKLETNIISKKTKLNVYQN